jgi:hypothetical protein
MKYVLIIIIIFSNLLIAGYRWPLQPFDIQHNISATFCENRPDGAIAIHHFHNAIDIPLGEGGEVYAIESGKVEVVVRTGYTAQIRVGRYNYLHVTPLPTLDLNDDVEAMQLVGHTNYANHIHLIDGYYPNYINPLREDGIEPFVDTYQPTVNTVNFYKDGSTTQFQNNKVFGLVDIVARLYDRTDSGPLGSNNGIYIAGYQIFDSTGTEALTDPVIPYQFDVRPSNSYITNVYFKGSDLSTYIYILTNEITRNGYWDTRDYDPGFYKIKVFTEDTRSNRTEYWTTVQIVEQDVSPPAKPVIDAFTGRTNGNWQLDWQLNDSSDVSGYDFMFTVNGGTFSKHESISQALSGSDTNYVYEEYGYRYPLYMRLRAYDNTGIRNYSEESNTYVLKLGEDEIDVLIVDGFSNDQGYWKSKRHDFVGDYAQMLLEKNFAFVSCSVDGLLRGKVTLTDYQTVIYFTGDDSELKQAEQELLAQYLETGGNLFITGSDLVSNLYAAGDSLFAEEILKVSLASDSSTVHSITDQNQMFFAQISQPYEIAPAGDVLHPKTSAVSILQYTDGKTAASGYTGMFGDSQVEAKVIVAGFPFELLSDEANRIGLFGEILDYFEVGTSIAEREAISKTRKFELLGNYPNPFNPSTEIRYHLNTGSQVDLEVYNTLGQKITTLISEYHTAGQYSVSFNALNLPSGIYYYRLQSGGQIGIGKMVLIK